MVYDRHGRELVPTWEQVLATECHRKMSSMLSMRTIFFNMLRLFEHDCRGRRASHLEREKSGNDVSVSTASKHLSTSDAEASNVI